MVKYPYLKQSGPRGIWCFRRSVPPRLRAILGKREVLISLRTPEVAPALAAYRDAVAATEALFAEAEQRAAEPLRPRRATASGQLSEQRGRLDLERRRLQQRCQAQEREFRCAARRRADHDPSAVWQGRIDGLPVPDARDLDLAEPANAAPLDAALDAAFRTRLRRQLTGLHAMRAAVDCRAMGIPLPRSMALRHLAHRCELEAQIHTFAAMLADASLVSPDPLGTRTPSMSQPAGGAVAPSPSGPLLSVAGQEWLEAHRGSWDAQRYRLCETILQDFIQGAGDQAIGGYRKAHGRAYLDLLRRLPANLQQRRHLLGVAKRDLAAIAAAAEAKGWPPQDAKTVNKKIAVLGQCFKWLNARYDECAPSPVDNLKVPTTRKAKDQKEPFSADELNRMLQAPVFTGCHSDRHWARAGTLQLRASAKFWVPLIGLFTGMRLSEICQLRLQHIRQHEGVFYIALTNELELKNAPSIRSVPIHQALIEMGLHAFVAARTDRLFPELKARPSRHADAFSKYFARFLRHVGIKRRGLDFHSLRHTFIASADASGVEFTVKERLVGHVLPGQAGRYGKRYADEQRDMQLLVTRNLELQKLRFDGVHFDHLRWSK